jgi:hypothetical protein
VAKVQLAVALSLLACLAAPVGAQAQTLAPVQQPAHIVFTEHEDHEDSEDSEDYEDDEDFQDIEDDGEFEEGQEDGDFVPLPPVVVSPHDGDFRHGPELDPYEGLPPIDAPKGAHPVRVDQVHPTQKTPADAFAEASYIALGALGLGAVSLGAVAGVRSYRVRKAGKADYFYES